MLFRTEIASNPNSAPSAQGYLITEDITGDFTYDVRAKINADIISLRRANYEYQAAIWSAYLYTSEVPLSVQGFDGNPPRYKLGSIAISTGDCVTDFYYWNYKRQGFPAKKVLADMIEYDPNSPISNAEIGAPGTTQSLTRALSLTQQPTQIPSLPTQTSVSPAFIFGSTGIHIAPANTDIIYNLCIAYFSSQGSINQDNPPQTIVNS